MGISISTVNLEKVSPSFPDTASGKFDKRVDWFDMVENVLMDVS